MVMINVNGKQIEALKNYDEYTDEELAYLPPLNIPEEGRFAYYLTTDGTWALDHDYFN